MCAISQLNSPVILVLGSSTSERQQLLTSLLGSQTLSLDEDASFPCIPWEIDNKYYTVTVALVLADSPATIEETLWERIDGVVYLYHPSKGENLSGLHQWHDEIESHDPEVLLCVAKHPDDVIPDHDLHDDPEIQDWCIKNGFEHVNVYQWKKGSAGAGTLENEAQGIDRILDALHANMWKGLEMKGSCPTVSYCKPLNDEDEDKGEEEEGKEAKGDGVNSLELPEEPAKVPVEQHTQGDKDHISPQSEKEEDVPREYRSDDPDEIALKAFLTPAEQRLVNGDLFDPSKMKLEEDAEMEDLDRMFVNLASLQ
eukprot:Ihof_evm5s161 gene=Ihof_evmTU5s161